MWSTKYNIQRKKTDPNKDNSLHKVSEIIIQNPKLQGVMCVYSQNDGGKEKGEEKRQQRKRENEEKMHKIYSNLHMQSIHNYFKKYVISCGIEIYTANCDSSM